MSHYTSVRLVCKNRASIVAALEAIGFQPTVHEEAINLYGIGGRKRPEKANIVVPRQQIASGANDLGFVFNPQTAAYDMIISDFDRHSGHCLPGRGLGKTFQQRFAQEYAIAAINRDGQFVVGDRKRQPDGSYRIELKAAAPLYEGVGFGAEVSSSSLSTYEV